MRDHDEQDPKKPHPLPGWKKGSNAAEAAEAEPWRVTPRQRHVA